MSLDLTNKESVSKCIRQLDRMLIGQYQSGTISDIDFTLYCKLIQLSYSQS